MFRKLVKTSEIEIDGRSYLLRYFEQRTARGASRFSCEVLLGAADRIILDDDSLTSLESRVARLAPATVYSRILLNHDPLVAA
jgi:hypothetical protein